MSQNRHTVDQDEHGDAIVISPTGEVVATYTRTAAGGSEHAEMLAGAAADHLDGLHG